jgi:hypothetical protein
MEHTFTSDTAQPTAAQKLKDAQPTFVSRALDKAATGAEWGCLAGGFILVVGAASAFSRVVLGNK